DGRKSCRAFHMDALDFLVNLDIKADVVYIDPPYPSTMNDYDSFYGHFDRMLNKGVDNHLDLTNKKTFLGNFEKLIKACVGKSKYVVISLNNKCYPSVDALASALSMLLIDYQIVTKEHVYKVTGKENKKTNYEILLICKLKESL
ncbi:MAG: DNA adenine methylase, partial [Clostridia bacterium]|nr:DNA adenine methylase [Clostridia bacterium]